MTTARRAGALALALVLVLVGGGLLAHQHWKVTTYEQTTGTVQIATMDSEMRYDDDSAGGERHYEPRVVYGYVVDGRTYTNDDISVGSDTFTERRQDADTVLDPYEQGGSTTVYYDPADPASSFLAPRYEFFPGGVLFALGMLLLADGLTPRTRVTKLLFSRVPVLGSTDSAPSVSDRSGVPKDPTAVLDDDADRTESDTEDSTAPVDGHRATAVWIGAGLLVLVAVGAFVLVSLPPHPMSLILTGVGATIALGRGIYQELMPGRPASNL